MFLIALARYLPVSARLLRDVIMHLRVLEDGGSASQQYMFCCCVLQDTIAYFVCRVLL